MIRMQETAFQEKIDVFSIHSDFVSWVNNDEFAESVDTGSVAEVADVPSGVVLIPTTAADNDMSILHTKQQAFVFQDKKPLWFEALFYFAEVTGDTSNLFIGFMDSMIKTDQPLQDDGAGVKADFCGFGFYRLDGGTVWNTIVDNETDFVQLTRALTADNKNNLSGKTQDADEDTLYKLSGQCRPLHLVSPTVLALEFDFWVDDVHVVHERVTMTIANFTNMHGGMAVHAGEAQITSIFADYADFSQARIAII